jgi:hypothetical protein
VRFLLVAGLALSFVGACVETALGEDARSIVAVHAIHAENEVDCETCHPDAWTSTSGRDVLRPSMDLCSDCHDVEDDTNCGTCHVSAEEPAGYAQRPVRVARFPHAVHVEGGVDCAACHALDEASEPTIPAMVTCRSCHATASALNDCRVCHGPEEELVPVSHVPDWQSLHAIEAAWDQASCASCHTQTDCQECHAGDNVRPRTHRLNFAFDHSLEARGHELDCATCHAEPEFCVACHAAEQVLPSDHSRADWVLATGGRHAEEARFGLDNCVSCHDAGESSPTCARCHGE